MQGREHPQAEQVELDQPDGGAVVLVPLQDAAVLHGRPLDRADLDHRPVADHHAAGVDPEVAREALDHAASSMTWLGDLVLDGGLDRPPGVHLPGPGVELAGRVPEGPAHVAHGRAGLVGDHVGDLGGPVAAVALVDVLDDLLAAAGLDVQVDVGRPVALRGQEPLEQQAEGDGVGLGDPDRVADGRVGRRAPALAVDVGAAAELHDVPDDQEVAGEAELLDHGQLVVDLAPGARSALGVPGAVAAGRAPAGQLAQPGHLGVAGRDREVGQAGRDQLQVEGKGPARGRRPARPFPGSGPGGSPARARTADGRRPRRAASRPGRPGSCGPGPRPARWPAGAVRGRVVDVVGRHHLDPGPVGQPDQGVVADRVERVAVVPDLHVEVVPPERLDEPVQLDRGRRRSPFGQRARHRPLPAPGQHRPVPAMQSGQPPSSPGAPPWPRPSAPPRSPGTTAHTPPAPAPAPPDAPHPGRASPSAAPPGDQRQLGAEDGREAQRPCRLGEADDAVHAVVVGDGQRLQAKVRRLLRQLLRVRAAIQEARVRVAVQLGIGNHHPPPPGGPTRAGRPIGLAPGRPGWGVASIRSGRLVGGRRPPGEPAFQLGPRKRRILPSHARDDRTYVRG